MSVGTVASPACAWAPPAHVAASHPCLHASLLSAYAATTSASSGRPSCGKSWDSARLQWHGCVIGAPKQGVQQERHCAQQFAGARLAALLPHQHMYVS